MTWVQERGVGVFSINGSLIALEGMIVDVSSHVRSELGRVSREMMSRFSHEFRTPLTAILKSAENIATFGHQLQPEQLNHLANIISRNAHSLGSFVEGLPFPPPILPYEVKTGLDREVRPQTTILEDLIVKVLDEVDLLAQRKMIHLMFTRLTNTQVKVDPTQFQLVIRIVVENAIKYSFPHQHVTITTQEEYFHTGNGTIRRAKVAVSDEGI